MTGPAQQIGELARADLAKMPVHRRARRQGVGDIPRYSLWPRRGYVSTTYYYRDLASGPERQSLATRDDARLTTPPPNSPSA